MKLAWSGRVLGNSPSYGPFSTPLPYIEDTISDTRKRYSKEKRYRIDMVGKANYHRLRIYKREGSLIQGTPLPIPFEQRYFYAILASFSWRFFVNTFSVSFAFCFITLSPNIASFPTIVTFTL